MLLWLGLASLALASLTSLANGAPLHVLAAPNKLRVGTEENIFVEVQDHSGSDNLHVAIKVLSYPAKTQELHSTYVTLTSQNHYQQLAPIKIPVEGFNTDPKVKQYVVVQAQFPDRTLEKVVMASFQSGYIFIQTDKTIYTPNSKVNYRMFAVTPGMDPIQRGAEGASVTVEIVNPDGITFSAGTVFLNKGIKSGNYDIPDITSLGLWKVVAKFANNPQESFNAEFEVSKYVLPTFEVKLDPEASFFYVDSQTFEVNIEAKYLYGEPVSGNAFVVFGVIQGNHKRAFPGSLKRIPVVRGEARATLKREYMSTENLVQLANNGSSIYVSVTVLTGSGSEMVEAEARGIRIVTSPYTISFKKSAKYFKPGMALDVLVQVMNPDETPAVNVPLLVNPGGLVSSTDDNGMAQVPVNIQEAAGSSLVITAKTTKQGIREDRQTQATMTVLSYLPPPGSNNYLQLGVEKAGNDITITFNFARVAISTHGVTYLILSRGQIVKAGYLSRASSSSVLKERVTVSKLMLPSFRVVGYYHASSTEVVSDSVLVYVKETCMGSLKIEVAEQEDFAPRGKMRLKVTGDKGARVGLVAVDKAVYVLNNKHRLTQKKVWSIVDRYDTGCTPGGGRNAMGVFYDAGLMFQSSTASGTPDRTDIKCPVSARRRRAAVNIADARTSLVSGFTDELRRRCCLDGMRDTPLSYNCQRRSEYIQDGPECKAAFLHCCQQLADQLDEHREDQLILARSDNFGNFDTSQISITSRTNFPESWLWNEIDLPAQCPTHVACETTTHIDPIRRERHLPDSITTWQISGVSLSADHGICVSQPLEVIVKKLFFVDLRLPYSAIRGEQIEIRAILHNLKSQALDVILELYDIKGVCSVASKRTKHTMKLRVGARTTRAVPFILIPMTEGQHEIEVKAFVPSLFSGDGIVRKLLVEPIGVLSKHPTTVTLDPATRGGVQKEHIYNTIPETERVVPGAKTKTFISVTGGNQLSGLVENALSGKALERFIKEPSGCGEQNIGKMTFPLIAATYLDKAQKWEDVGFSRRDETLNHIKKGYQTELAYRFKSGCFSIWSEQDSVPCSTWLTAYVVKVFSMARSLVTVEDAVICDAVKWLILHTQQPDGIFKEIGQLYTPSMSGNLLGADTDVSMTAFTLIAMQEARPVCSNRISSMPRSIDKAVAYLERRLPGLARPYAAAITSYALANEEKLNKDILFRFAVPGRDHWRVDGGFNDFTREATGYALLALVKAKAFEESKPIVKWLNSQRLEGQSYGSTQVTMIVYQALAEYWANVQEEPFDMNLEIDVAGRAKIDRWHFDKANSYTTRSSKVDGIKSMNVTARGSGEATLTVVSLYYALPIPRDGDCEKFDLEVKFALEKSDESGDIYKLEIEVLYKDRKEDAKMTVLDISLPTGFDPDNNDLERLSKGVDRVIQRYELDSLTSENTVQKGSVIIYLDKVSHVQRDQIAFHLIQKFKVGVLQPAAVSVYEYYEKKPCVKFYHPYREKGQILQLCQQDDNTCVCAEETCSKQRKDKITNSKTAYAQRFAMACNTEANNKTDYVYKVRVEHVQNGTTVDVYRMRIEEVLKEGTDPPQGVLNTLRSFVSLPQCRHALALEETKTYLIMGLSDDLYKVKKTNEYEYSIGERTWLEYWPTATECQSAENRPLCLALKRVKDQLLYFGCPD